MPGSVTSSRRRSASGRAAEVSPEDRRAAGAGREDVGVVGVVGVVAGGVLQGEGLLGAGGDPSELGLQEVALVVVGGWAIPDDALYQGDARRRIGAALGHAHLLVVLVQEFALVGGIPSATAAVHSSAWGRPVRV